MSLFDYIFPQPKPVRPVSCFVKGVARSLRETPGEWKLDESTFSWFPYLPRWWRHTSGLILSVCGGYDDDLYVSVLDYDTTDAEKTLLSDAVYEVLEKPHRESYEAAMAAVRNDREAKAAALRAPFERLGCPDTQA